MKYLGIDIGGTAVKLGIVSDRGEVLQTHSKDVAFDQYETPIIETVLIAVDEMLEINHIKKEDLGGIGVSATGQIDYREGVVIGVGGNIKNWLGTQIKNKLEAKYQLKTTVVNDANCMILGEAWVGAAANCDHVIGITIGTGVGGGILIDKNILHGNLGIAAELGHFSIHREGILCTCGNVGCYEQYASMTALVKAVKSNQQELGIAGDINGKVIFETLKNGHPGLQIIVDRWLADVATGLVSLTHLFNPELIVIGGGVSKQEDLFIKPVSDYVHTHVMKKFGEGLRVVAASLGNDAGLVGAVYYHLNQK